jgi:hypothetical protein
VLAGSTVSQKFCGTMSRQSRDIQGTGDEADGATAMTRRKGKITRSDLKRKSPHHVALKAIKNSE